MDDQNPKIDVSQIPEWQMNQLCRTLLDACKRYYSDPENVRKYEEWKASGLTIQEWSEKQKQHRGEVQC